jgi:hypothetical protein
MQESSSRVSTCDVGAHSLACGGGPASQLQHQLSAGLPHAGAQLRAAPSRTHVRLVDHLRVIPPHQHLPVILFSRSAAIRQIGPVPQGTSECPGSFS